MQEATRAANPSPKEASEKPARRPLPAELPREANVHEHRLRVSGLRRHLRPLGEDVSEMLEYVPSHFKVIRHVRPKLSCGAARISCSLAPSRPIERGLAGPDCSPTPGLQVRRSSSFVSPEPDLCPRGGRARSLHAGRLGRRCGRAAGSVGGRARALRVAPTSSMPMTPRCRCSSRPRQDQDRAAVDLRAR